MVSQPSPSLFCFTRIADFIFCRSCFCKTAEALKPTLLSSELSKALTRQGIQDETGPPQLDHFHLFVELPAELRQMIFQACLPRRIFMFSYERSRLPREQKRPKELFERKPAAFPWIALVCKEALEISKLFVREFHMNSTDVISHESRQYMHRTTKIRFDLGLDTLLINYRAVIPGLDRNEGVIDHDQYLQDLHDGPYALISKPKVNVIVYIVSLVTPRFLGSFRTKWLTSRPIRDFLAQQSHCTVILAASAITATGPEIRSSGLFGMFGEERSVLVDINDTAKIDQYESYIKHFDRGVGWTQGQSWSYFPRGLSTITLLPTTRTGRYGTYRRAISNWESVQGEDAAALPTFRTVAEEDTASALWLIKQSWLETNHCFEPANHPLVPWTGSVEWRKWDDEHHVVKHWLSKLPTFSFVVMYTVAEEPC